MEKEGKCEFLQLNGKGCVKNKINESEYCLTHHLEFKKSIDDLPVKFKRESVGKLYIECEGKKYRVELPVLGDKKIIKNRVISTGEEKELSGVDKRVLERNVYNWEQ
jgi:hypothetical protein